jgi:hypothetical protein
MHFVAFSQHFACNEDLMKRTEYPREQETPRRLTDADVEFINRKVDEWHDKIRCMKEAILAGNDTEALRWAREVCGLPPAES